MYNFDPYNVLLAITTNIPRRRLNTGFVLQGHISLNERCKSVKLMSLCFSQTADGKENRGINGTNIKEVKRVKTLAELDKNTSSKKGLGISSLAKAQTQTSSNSRNACREGLHVLRTQSNKTASLQNPRKPHDAEKTAAPFKKTQSVQPKAQPASHAANTTRISSLVSIRNTTQPGRSISTEQSRTKTDIQPTKKTSIKSSSAADVTSRRPMNTTLQRHSVCKTQEKPVPKPRSPSAVHSRKPNRSDVSRRKDALVDATKSTSNSSVTVKATRPSVSSALSKPANRASAAVTKNKPPAAVKLTNAAASTKPAGRSSRSCVLPQKTAAPPELKISSRAKPAVQIETPKSRLCPGAQGVRTAPVDGEKKPSAAQEERL